MLEPGTTATLGRRSVLGLPALLALAGCGTTPGPGRARGAATTTAAPATETVVGDGARDDRTADEALLATAVLTTERALIDLALAARRSPGLVPRLAPATRVHTAHRAVLAEADAAPAPGATRDRSAVPPAEALPRSAEPAAVLALLARRERAAAVRLADLAVAADSGPFARLLGSCSAAVATVAADLAGDLDGALADGAVSLVALAEPSAAGRTLDGSASAVDALQGVLAAEHAAVWVLGVLAARTSRTAQPDLAATLVAAHDAHRDRRDLLQVVLRARGVAPVPPAPSYVLPASSTAGAVAREAARLEEASGTWWAAVVVASTATTRAVALAALRDTAIRGLAVRGRPEAFPGAGELADR